MIKIQHDDWPFIIFFGPSLSMTVLAFILPELMMNLVFVIAFLQVACFGIGFIFVSGCLYTAEMVKRVIRDWREDEKPFALRKD